MKSWEIWASRENWNLNSWFVHGLWNHPYITASISPYIQQITQVLITTHLRKSSSKMCNLRGWGIFREIILGISWVCNLLGTGVPKSRGLPFMSECVPLTLVTPRLRWFSYDTLAWIDYIIICAMVKSRYIGDGHPTFNRNPYNGYINPYYWVDDHPLLYGNNGILDPGTYTDMRASWYGGNFTPFWNMTCQRWTATNWTLFINQYLQHHTAVEFFEFS